MIKQIAEGLRSVRGKVLILTHHNADIDAVASAIGIFHCLNDVDLGAAESVSKTAKSLVKDYEFLIDPDCKKYDYVILVETSVPEQLSGVKNLRADMIIDHHPQGKLDAKIKWIDENKRSCSQMAYEILKEMKVDVDGKLAKILLSGIIADTAYLRIADIDTLKTIIELIKKGATIEESMEIISANPDASEIVACFKAANRADLYRIGDIMVAFSNVSSHEAAASRAFVKLGADIAVVAAIKDKELRISSRGKTKISGYGIDLSEIFKQVGEMIEGSGGGHNLAGSANGKNVRDTSEIFKFILKEISKKIGKEAKKM